MATYLTTYRAGISKMQTAGNHDPADATAPAWDPAAEPDTGHPSSADKHIDQRWPIDPPPPGYQGEVPPVVEGTEPALPPDPPVGQTALEGDRA